MFVLSIIFILNYFNLYYKAISNNSYFKEYQLQQINQGQGEFNYSIQFVKKFKKHIFKGFQFHVII
jgi:hypothetical protein